MSFDRLRYDERSYQHAVQESVGAGLYMLGTPRIGEAEACFFPDPSVRLNGHGASICKDRLVDVDSELMGLHRRASRCPREQFIPDGKDYCQATNMKECRALGEESTRLTNPPCTLRSTGWNRWEWLCQNPQDNAVLPFQQLIDNRLIVKDNHRPCLPKPIDPTLAMPPGANEPVLESYLPAPPAGKVPTVDSALPAVNWSPCK